MPLIKCPKCGSTISTSAVVCPKCKSEQKHIQQSNINQYVNVSKKTHIPEHKNISINIPKGSTSLKNEEKKNNMSVSEIVLLVLLGIVVIAGLVGWMVFSNWLKVTCPILFFSIVIIGWLNNKYNWF